MSSDSKMLLDFFQKKREEMSEELPTFKRTGQFLDNMTSLKGLCKEGANYCKSQQNNEEKDSHAITDQTVPEAVSMPFDRMEHYFNAVGAADYGKYQVKKLSGEYEKEVERNIDKFGARDVVNFHKEMVQDSNSMIESFLRYNLGRESGTKYANRSLVKQIQNGVKRVAKTHRTVTAGVCACSAFKIMSRELKKEAEVPENNNMDNNGPLL